MRSLTASHTHSASLSAEVVCNSFGYGRLLCNAQHCPSHALPECPRSIECKMQMQMQCGSLERRD